MPHEVFITYSSHDKPYADAICHGLESVGVACWIAPRDILPSSVWAEAIIDAISTSRLLIVIFSGHSNASPQVIREVERAVNRRIPVIPVRIEDVAPSKAMEYFLSSPHWLDALTEPLEEHIERLVTIVRTLLQKDGEHRPFDGGELLPKTGDRGNVRKQESGKAKQTVREQVRKLMTAPASFVLPRPGHSRMGKHPRIAFLVSILIGAAIIVFGVRYFSRRPPEAIEPGRHVPASAPSQLHEDLKRLRLKISQARALSDSGAYASASAAFGRAVADGQALAGRYPASPVLDSAVSELVAAMAENIEACTAHGQLLSRRGLAPPPCK